MTIWFALLIPVLTAAVLHFGFRHRIVWWELVLPFAVCLLLTVMAKNLIAHCQTHDTEYWTTYAVRAEYWEDWSELVVKTRTVSDGKTTRTEVYTEVDYHPPEWYVYDQTGKRHAVSSAHFEAVAAKFGERKFQKVSRFAVVVKSGGLYTTSWPATDATMEVLSTAHSYTNRVQAAPSVFNHRKIGKEEKAHYGLFDYPTVSGLHQQMVLGLDDPAAERTLQLWNAKLGAAHQIRMWVLVFTDQPMDAAFSQESYWNGGNKNELVLCVGVDQQKTVQWGYVFSWTEREGFKADARTRIEVQIGKPLNAAAVVNEVAQSVPTGWERKRFRDFDYLSVEPPTWSVVLVYCLTLLTCVGGGVWFVCNEYRPNESTPHLSSVGPMQVVVGVACCCLLVLALFVGLKVGGLLHWNWWWVLSPLWGPLLPVSLAGLVIKANS